VVDERGEEGEGEEEEEDSCHGFELERWMS
jgi:hypothetical protein